MKHLNTFLLVLLVGFSTTVYGQFWTEDFETDGNGSRYSTSVAEFSDGGGDFFTRTDGSNIGSYYELTGLGGTYYFAGMDIDGEGAGNTQTLLFDNIDISGKSNLQFGIKIAEDDDGTNQDWDANTFLKIQYDIDNSGTYKNLIWVSSEGDTNTEPKIDSDFDGIGDGTVITSTFAEFTALIGETGSTIDILITFEALDAGDEDAAIDDLYLKEFNGNVLPSISGVSINPAMDITSSQSVEVSATITDDGSIVTAGLAWALTPDAQNTNPVIMTNGGSGDVYTGTIPAQADGATVYFLVAATDNSGESNASAILSYMVRDPKTASLPYTQEFDSDLGDFYTYSGSGDTKKWGWNSSNSDGYAGMNGFNSGDLEVDYLISPAFNFDATSDEALSFKSWRKYGTDDVDNYLKLYYSTNYAGLGDPTAADWTELTGVAFASVAETWTQVDDFDVSMINGTSVHFAFVYNYNSGSYVNWEIDSIVLKENPATVLNKTVADVAISTIVKDRLNIYSDGVYNIDIYSLSGIRVKSAKDIAGSLDIATLPKGIYIVKLSDENGNEMLKKISRY